MDRLTDIEHTHALLLEIAEERSLARLLERTVAGLVRAREVALARIWLIEPGDICPTCLRRDECPRSVPCLHLVASAGRPRAAGEDWARIDGAFGRFPIGVRKVGRIGAGETIAVPCVQTDPTWIARPEWTAREGIVGFGGVPLVFRDEVLGALALFTRERFESDALAGLRLVANHAAAAIAHARAFEEIRRLRERLEVENDYLREEVREARVFGSIVGSAPALARVLEQIALVAPTEASVLILGESGTGKELVARELHARSARAAAPLVKVNCASIPAELYESEFFGHVRGAFTGAHADRLGRFAAADGGTLFLDEVGEIPLALQAKLLRVLQEGTFERVGEERTRRVDVRVVAATNRDLRAEVAAGRFREDLFYRLHVFPIEVPPLRERAEDVPALAAHFLERFGARHSRRDLRLSRAQADRLARYAWPGNVRELQNVVERAVIASPPGRLRFDLPADLPAPATRRRPSAEGEAAEIWTEDAIRAHERANALAALEQAGWRIHGPGGAAERLGVRPTTLASRIKKWGIARPR